MLFNTSVPDSVLKKNISRIAYHFVRECVSNDEWRTAYIATAHTPSDLLMRFLPAGLNMYREARCILYTMCLYGYDLKGDAGIYQFRIVINSIE